MFIMSLTVRINRIGEDGKAYYKYEVRIPPDIIDDLGWKKRQKLKFKVERGKLIIQKK